MDFTQAQPILNQALRFLLQVASTHGILNVESEMFRHDSLSVSITWKSDDGICKKVGAIIVPEQADDVALKIDVNAWKDNETTLHRRWTYQEVSKLPLPLNQDDVETALTSAVEVALGLKFGDLDKTAVLKA